MPFQDNVFTFGSYHVFERFLVALVPAQAHAITSITLANAKYPHSGVGQLIGEKLTGLKRLISFVEFDSGVATVAFVRDDEGRRRRALECSLFERAPLIEAVVVARQVYHRGHSRRSLGFPRAGRSSPMVPEELADGWARALEERLVVPWEK